MMSIAPDIVVVIAAYNEGAVLGRVLDELKAVVPDVVVVDDGSVDDTREVAHRHARWTLHHHVNRGQGAALQTGIAFALKLGARRIVTFDADGQHEPADIPRLLQALDNGHDVALGSRFLGDAIDLPTSRRLLLRVAVAFTRLASGGIRVTDTHNGLRAFSRQAAERIEIRLDRMAHASELLDIIARLGLPYCEVPVRIRYTAYSRGKGQTIGAAPRILIHYLLGRVLP